MISTIFCIVVWAILALVNMKSDRPIGKIDYFLIWLSLELQLVGRLVELMGR